MAIQSIDLAGKQVMITGCTAGLGRAAAIAMAEMGATLSLVCRSRIKGERLLEDIRRKSGREDCELYVGDLGSQHDIRAVAKSYLAKDRPLDILFNNVGVVMLKREVTSDGFETTFGVNHLAYFLLTVLLMDSLKSAPAGRIVNTATNIGGTSKWMRCIGEACRNASQSVEALLEHGLLQQAGSP